MVKSRQEKSLRGDSVPEQVLEHSRYAFVVEWNDFKTHSVNRYQLLYFPETQQIEMHDMKSRRVFLKRSRVKSLKPELLCIGHRFNVLSRQLTIVDYGDQSTRDALQAMHERSCLLVKLTEVQKIGRLLQGITANGIYLKSAPRQAELAAAVWGGVCRNVKIVKLTEDEARRIASLDADIAACGWPLEERSLVMEVIGFDAVEKTNKLRASICKSDDTETAKSISTASTYAPVQVDAAKKLLTLFSAQPPADAPWIDGSTLALLKPHTLRDGTEGMLIEALSKGFCTHNVRSVAMRPEEANDFCQVYRDVDSPGEFAARLEQWTSGRCIALHVSSADLAVENSTEALRRLCGPPDPELCRYVYPTSLRARFGVDKARNAIHCTDLEGDAQLELQYIFEKLQDPETHKI